MKTGTRLLLALAVLAVVPFGPLAPAVLAQTAPPPPAPADSAADLAKMEAMAAGNKASMVIVEYEMQYDKGDAPQGVANFEGSIIQERPLERPGVLVDATHVVTDDLMLHPRFIKSIKVRSAFGDAAAKVDAKVSAYPKQQNAVILELAGAVAGGKAPAFDTKREGAYTLEVRELDGGWATAILPQSPSLIISGGKSFHSSGRGLVVDKEGAAVGVTTGVRIAADGSWKGSPMQWPAVSTEGMKELLAQVQAKAEKGIVPVTLNLRMAKGASARDRYISSMGDEDSNVQHVLGVFTDPKTLVVLASFKPTTTARLERIRVMTNPPMDAKFAGTLMDYGAFVATTEKAAEGALTVSTADIRTMRDYALVPTAQIMLHGEDRTTYYQPQRMQGLSIGYHGNVYPDVSGEDGSSFVFDEKGSLLAFPIPVREKAATESRYGRSRPTLTFASQVQAALAKGAASFDPNNVPLSEDQENRLAWFGWELQPLTPDLARANNVADQTQDGRMGALVTFVYPDSPAAKAGVQVGWVLLRVDVDGQPKPIDVQVDSDPYSDEPFPWDRLDSAPEQVFDRIPTPWPNAESSLVRSLTDMGFGKKFTAEFFHDKKVDKKDFTITQGPATYASAPKYKHDGLGITVKELTYEVRRYMQKKEDEPGVIISKIEMGSKASKAGIKPYEVITHVNDQPVKNVKEFENAVKDQTELSLSIKRMTAGRIVKVTLDKAAGTEPAGGGGGGAATKP